ncbi:MAG: hypothetical protein V8R75_05960 [Oscillospiraceae bacterium]
MKQPNGPLTIWAQKKLPTVKILQAEYADLLIKKKTAYEDFKRLRKESQELQTVKANVDALLRIEQVQDYEQEKEKKSGTGPVKLHCGFTALSTQK